MRLVSRRRLYLDDLFVFFRTDMPYSGNGADDKLVQDILRG